MRWLIAAGLAAVLIFLGCARRQRVTEAGVQDTVDRLIPVGSTPQHALSVLDSLKVEHSAYGTNKIVTANFGETSSKALVTGAVYVTLYFDGQDRMSRREVKERFTGP